VVISSIFCSTSYALAISSSLNVRFTVDALNALSNNIACCSCNLSSSDFPLNKLIILRNIRVYLYGVRMFVVVFYNL